MEKATLLVTVSKKNKIIVELQFENGKKMPLLLELEDIKLNNTEVQVKREQGKPVLVEADGKVLFPANEPKSISSPIVKHKQETLLKPDIKQISLSETKHKEKIALKLDTKQISLSEQPDGRSISKQDLQYDQVSHVSYPAFAPYNFIPLNKKIVCNSLPVPKLNKYNKYEAIFTITEQCLEKLKAENVPDEILKKLESLKDQNTLGEEEFLGILKKTIGDEQSVKFKSLIVKLAKYDIARNNGWIDVEIEAITPLYIRGTLTESEVKQQADIKEVEQDLDSKDKPRDSKNKPDFFAPVKRISIPGSSLRGMTRNMVEIVSFGKFEFFEDRRLYYRGLADQSNLREEYQSKMSSFDRQKRRAQYNFSVGVLRKSTNPKENKGLHFEIKSSGDRFDRILKSEAKSRVERNGEKYEEFKFYRLGKDFLVVSGNMPNKKYDWLIYYPHDDAEIIAIDTEDIRNYEQDRTRGKRVTDMRMLDKARKGEEVPCFFVRWKEKDKKEDEKDKNRVSFGHTGMFRLAYEKTIDDHIKQEEDKDKIDFAEAIFGNEKTHSGRVFFEDAFLIDGQGDPQLEARSPKILSSPKPTTFQQYLVQNSTEKKELNHYNSNSSIRGYKCYWHKSGEDEKWVQTDKLIEKNDKQYTSIQPVKPGTRFHGRIRFENLSNEELGALLFALDLPKGCGHKLGMGKPLGLGSISVTPTLYLSDVKKRYREFFAEWYNDVPMSNELDEKKQVFERYVLGQLGESKLDRLWETDRLHELLVMLRYDLGKNLEKNGKNRYFTIEKNEFKDRHILPKPSALVSTSDNAQIRLDLKKSKQNPIHTEEKKST